MLKTADYVKFGEKDQYGPEYLGVVKAKIIGNFNRDCYSIAIDGLDDPIIMQKVVFDRLFKQSFGVACDLVVSVDFNHTGRLAGWAFADLRELRGEA